MRAILVNGNVGPFDKGTKTTVPSELKLNILH